MPSVYETNTSRECVFSNTNPSRTKRYRIEDTDDELVAYGLVAAAAPKKYLNLFRGDIRIAPHEGQLGFWDGDVQYVPPTINPLEVGEFRLNIKTTGGTRTIKLSKQTRRAYSSTAEIFFPGVLESMFGGLIGVSDSGVDGVEIVSPVFEWTEERTFLTGSVTLAYLKKLQRMTGTVNNSPFRGFDSGEILFMGAEAGIRTGEHWRFVFTFRGSPNVANFTQGAFTGIRKDGHEYSWTFDTPGLSATPAQVVRQPRYLFIEKVYEEVNFADLGIGILPLV